MPGIVGLCTSMPPARAELELLRMVEALRHENFYVTGTWQDPALGVYVGWVARKGSFAESMPLQDDLGEVVLVLSGEAFSQTAADMLRGYRGDPSLAEGLNGRFHGLVVNRTLGTATLFNDRYGMHRIYYHPARDGFYFAAEAKAILAVRPELRRIDPRGMGELVTCGCVMENRTLFPDVAVLPGAASWVFRRGVLEQRQTYFQPAQWEEQPRLEPEPYYRRLRDVFAGSVPGYFAGPEPIAMSLTGGLDTRMIMAWQRPPPGSLPCYTFGGMLRESRDVLVARRVAKVSRQPHEVIAVGADFLARFPHYAERAVYLTDGCVDVSRAPDLYLNERAREIAPVRMTGNYGGEVLRRLRAFKPQAPAPGLFEPEFSAYVRGAEETYGGLLAGHPLSFTVFRQGPWHHYGILALEETQLSLRSPYLDNELVRTVFRAPESAAGSNALCLRLISEGNPALSDIRTDRGVGGNGGRISSAVARAVLEASFKAEYAYDIGMPQWLARLDHRLAGLHLGRLVLGRHKPYQFRTWYRDALAGYVRDVLLDPRSLSRPYLRRRGVQAMVQGHLDGRGNYTTELHKLLSLELLHRLFVDGT